MLKYQLLLFLRNFRRNKLFSFINVIGLSAGIASALIIYVYVTHELSYDTFHKDLDRIYRVNQTFIWGEDNDHQFASTGPAVAHALNSELPEIEEVTRLHTAGNFMVSYEDSQGTLRSFDEQSILAADSNFFNIFTFPAIAGNPNTMLSKPQALVMTASTAKRYFGDENALGRLVTLGLGEDQQTYSVSGIIEDVPPNSYIDFDILLSMNSFPDVKRRSWSWIWTGFVTFAKLDSKASIASVEAKLGDIPRKYAEPTIKRVMGQTFDEYIASGKEWNLYFQPMSSVYLHSSNVYNRLNAVGNIKIVYALLGAGLFIILLSCVNFMNLMTSQYTNRAKSAGIRKVLGSSRGRLSGQYFGEAFIFCLIALFVGCLVAWYSLPLIGEITNKELAMDLWGNPAIIGVAIGLLIGMSALAGIYPALFLSAFHPIDAMKGRLKTGKDAARIRNSMVVFQFASSIILIICTAVVFQQLNYANQKDLGFDRENLVVLPRAEWIDAQESFVHEMQQIPGVIRASVATSVPPRIWDGDLFKVEGSSKDGVPINYVKADEHYLETLGLELVKGRKFSKELAEDKNGVILNETAVKSLGWSPDDPLENMRLLYPGTSQKFRVIGIVKDFNYWSLHTPIEPWGLFHKEGNVFGNQRNFITLRVQPQTPTQWNQTLAAVEGQWKSFLPAVPFEYEFVDDAFANSFESVERFGELLTVFAGLAILIAGLGLLGMIIYTLEQKTKEIGIRKVVGATALSIVILLSKSYTRLILISIAVGSPIALWILRFWLQDFEYQVPLSPVVFILAGIGTMSMAVLITIYHSLKAARMNPVEILKDE